MASLKVYITWFEDYSEGLDAGSCLANIWTTREDAIEDAERLIKGAFNEINDSEKNKYVVHSDDEDGFSKTIWKSCHSDILDYPESLNKYENPTWVPLDKVFSAWVTEYNVRSSSKNTTFDPVAKYCDNDISATKAVFDYLCSDNKRCLESISLITDICGYMFNRLMAISNVPRELIDAETGAFADFVTNKVSAFIRNNPEKGE